MRGRVLVGIILVVHLLLLMGIAFWNSPAIDEVGHMAAGLNHWRTGTFDLYRVNPPLVRLVATLPLAGFGLREPVLQFDTDPPNRPEFGLGRELVSQHGPRAFWYFTVARWACLPFALLGGYICYRWARELYGLHSGLLAGLTHHGRRFGKHGEGYRFGRSLPVWQPAALLLPYS